MANATTIQTGNGGQKSLTPEQQDKVVEYTAFGTKNPVRLTVGMVRNTLCKASRQGHRPSDVDCLKFIKRCQSHQIDPWLDEAYLVGYDRYDRNRVCTGADFTMIIGYGVYLKRAELNPDFNGFQSGVVVMVGTDMVEREGDLVLPGEVLVGGWCKVFRKNLAHPIFKRASLATCAKNTDFWQRDPGMMIVKSAESDAFRAAFPSTIGHLYMEQEMEAGTFGGHEEHKEPAALAPAPVFGGIGDQRVLSERTRTTGLRDEYGIGGAPAPVVAKEEKPKPKQQQKPKVVKKEEEPELAAAPAPEPEPEKAVEAPAGVENAPALDPQSPHGMLQKKLDEYGFDFNTLVGWATRSGNYPDADTHSTLGEVPRGIVERWLRAWMGLKVGLEDYKRGAYDQ